MGKVGDDDMSAFVVVEDEDGKKDKVWDVGVICQFGKEAKDVGLVLKRARSTVRGPLGGVLLL